ncbi:glutathione S-transferase family protein [Mariniluteicoccus endophyticus]
MNDSGATKRAAYVELGQDFRRDMNYIQDRVVADASAGTDPQGRRLWPVQSGRYRLIAARACPWANRTMIVRRLLGLEDAISLGMPGPTHDVDSWVFDLDPGMVDPVLGLTHLKQAYDNRVPDYPRGITVPALVDIETQRVVTNDFAQITQDFALEWTAHHREGAPDLWPAETLDEMHSVMEMVFTEVNNGVYRCGFAGSQEAYDAAYDRLFTALDTLDERLRTRRFLMGGQITEADVRLFTTLARFDPVYHGHFKCNRQRLSDFGALWAYARDLYQTPGFGDTIDFVQIKQHYYVTHSDINPTQVVPAGPDLSGWLAPHHREELGDRPFGDGTPPGPVAAGEEVPHAHTAHGTGRPTADETAHALAYLTR